MFDVDALKPCPKCGETHPPDQECTKKASVGYLRLEEIEYWVCEFGEKHAVGTKCPKTGKLAP